MFTFDYDQEIERYYRPENFISMLVCPLCQDPVELDYCENCVDRFTESGEEYAEL